MRLILRLVTAICCFMVISSGVPLQAAAHPEDEFCTPNGGMDPALCRELAKIDQKNAIPEKRVSNEPSETVMVNLDRSGFATFAFYIRIGFAHILPMGADHILFVLVLFPDLCVHHCAYRHAWACGVRHDHTPAINH